MSNRYAEASAEAIPHRVCGLTSSGRMLHPIAAVITAARALWPSKTALELAARTGVSERSAKYWLARKCDLSAEHLAELLRSDAGLSVLDALMGDARPDWWRDVKRRLSIAAARREAAAAMKRIADAEAEEIR